MRVQLRPKRGQPDCFLAGGGWHEACALARPVGTDSLPYSHVCGGDVCVVRGATHRFSPLISAWCHRFRVLLYEFVSSQTKNKERMDDFFFEDFGLLLDGLSFFTPMIWIRIQQGSNKG